MYIKNNLYSIDKNSNFLTLEFECWKFERYCSRRTHTRKYRFVILDYWRRGSYWDLMAAWLSGSPYWGRRLMGAFSSSYGLLMMIRRMIMYIQLNTKKMFTIINYYPLEF